MKNIFNFLTKNDIGNPPWDYYFLYNLSENEYPKYLAKIFNYRTGEKLPLRFDFKTKNWIINKNKCKTFNQKIQWLKLYGVTDLRRNCTDKVKVRDYVKAKIGEEYLKPVIQICDSFDEIDFDRLPNSFVMKCNHGCKWQYIIKDKEQYLQNKRLIEIIKRNMTGWLEQEYWCWAGFEMQYKGITPKILIEEFIGSDKELAKEVEVFCFNAKPKLLKYVHNDIPNKISMYDENLNNIDFKFLDKEILVKTEVDDYINQTFDLSIKLAEEFNFVRVDWLIFNKKLYFNELIFGNDMSGKIEGTLQESTKKEIQARASQYINKKQINQLKNIITLFKDYFNINKQRKIIVGIDNLDENWIDDDTKYKLIDALLNAIKLFIDIPNLKILLAMRADLFAKTCNVTKRQNEKDLSYILKINWTKSELINLINKRLQYMFEFKYKKNSKISINDIFDYNIDNISASDYIISRTMLRPRDIIEFINFCIEEADGQTIISKQNVLSAEKHFRHSRLEALTHEWFNIYGDINPYIEIIKILGNQFKYKALDIDATYSKIEKISYNCIKNCDLFEKFMENNSDLFGKEQNIKETLNTMYTMGIIGIKEKENIQYSTPNNPTLTPYDYYSTDLEFVVHPLFQIK